MTTLVTRWIAPAPALVTAWFGPAGQVETMLARSPDAADVPVVIGPRGVPGPQGPAGSGGVDPGDLTLYFINGLT